MAKTTNLNENTRLISFNNDLGKKSALLKTFEKLYTENKGDWSAINKALKKNKSFSATVINNLSFTNDLGDWTGDNKTLVSLFQKNKDTNSMRDIALTINKKDFKTLITGAAIPKGETKTSYGDRLYNELYAIEPTAVVVNMINDPKVTLLDDAIGAKVASVLEKQPEFNIKTTSIYEVIKKKDVFKDIPAESHEAVKTQLKTLQRIAAVSPVPDAVPVLYKANLHTALRISDMPPAQFMAMMNGKGLDDTTLIQIHSNAQQARVRNEQTLMALREVRQGTGVAMIDKSLSMGDEVNADGSLLKTKGNTYSLDQVTQEAIDEHNLSWNLLFGDADFCECSECNSVYSATAYFVELLQYLRNNNLDPKATGAIKIKSDPKDISNTPLEKLFSRRSDLGCLELTCKNTDTILPYVDLVNEVMENYVVSRHLKPFNVKDETSSELLAAPQHTEYQAYSILKDAVYPFTLPYHQPIDAARIYLKQLDTSRYEVIRTFRKNNSGKLTSLQDEAFDRAADAEFLGLTKEEYVILTKESFESKALMDKLEEKIHTDSKYQKLIGVKPIYEYYGYENAVTMLGDAGLTLIKKEFLRRTGIDYFNLVDVLKTEYINPSMPKGKSKIIMESLRFSYRFLQNYAKVRGIDKMAEDLVKMEKLPELILLLKEQIEILTNKKPLSCPNPSQEQPKITDKDIIYWVKCNFEKVGKMIVIESGRGCVNGKILSNQQADSGENANRQLVVENCKISYGVGVEKKTLASIDKKTGKVISVNPQISSNSGSLKNFVFIGDKGEKGIFLTIGNEVYLIFVEQKDSCDLDTALLQHLDGTSLTAEEYDRIHRFIRLWHKLGWTIDETDKAIVGLSIEKIQKNKPASLKDDRKNTKDDSNACKEEEKVNPHYDINPIFIHQLTAVKKLLDKTGIELIKLLSFWTTISTAGEESLYQHLFLTHNLLGVDKVFEPDNGNYLNGNAKISEHIPVLMAALNLSADDIEDIIKATTMEDKLTISSLSVLYRYRLLSKALGLRIPAFITILPLFGDIFKDAHATVEFIERWSKMEDAGFTAELLNYIINETDSDIKPLTPSEKDVLVLSKKIYDGLNSIEREHADLVADSSAVNATEKEQSLKDKATSELLRSKASLLYDAPIVEQIISILNAADVFKTPVPKNLDIDWPSPNSLKDKVEYDKSVGILTITGVLSQTETNVFNNLMSKLIPAIPGKPAIPAHGIVPEVPAVLAKPEVPAAPLPLGWTKGLSDVITLQAKQEDEMRKLFQLVLSGIFGNSQQVIDSFCNIGASAPKKLAFIQVFLSYLRTELTNRFITEEVSSVTGLDKVVVQELIVNIIKTGSSFLYNTLATIKESGFQNIKVAFLIPAAGADYTFVIRDKNIQLKLNEKEINFSGPADINGDWQASKPESLQAGNVLKLSMTYDPAVVQPNTALSLKDVYWKTTLTQPGSIPASQLIPQEAYNICLPTLTALKKSAILINTFKLSAYEINYLHGNHDFDSNKSNPLQPLLIDFNDLKLLAFLRIADYCSLRNSLPQTKTNILDFWKWTNDSTTAETDLNQKIAELTLWKIEDVGKLISSGHFNLSKKDFKNELNLLKLQRALAVASKIGMGINNLFEWAVPSSDFKDCKSIAESIQNAIHAQYNQADWEQVVKPLNDQLRNNQKNALIAYLLQQKELKTAHVIDADGLFEYFLIDVQMDACMETSRIKQAISSVQLFIQRCFLGLEEEYSGIAPNVLYRGRWEWMQRYRVWEANRKVFVYPENWIESNLRDDKSPFFKELESELLQKDINKQNVEDALKTYLYKVDEVANMEVIGLYIEERKKLHVFSRTRNAPYFSFYRYLDIEEGNWYPWEKMQVDIPSYDVEDITEINLISSSPKKVFKLNPDYRKIIGNGCYLTSIVWNDRLLIFFPQFMRKTKPNDDVTSSKSLRDISDDSTNSSRAIEYWEIKIAWSEYRNGKWTQKQLSKDAIYDFPDNISAVTKFWKFFYNSANAKSKLESGKSEEKDAWENYDKEIKELEDQYSNIFKIRVTITEDSINIYIKAASNNILLMSLPITQFTALVKAIKRITEANDIVVGANAASSAADTMLAGAMPPLPGPDIANYEFVPVIFADNLLGIEVYYDKVVKGIFTFNGSNITTISTKNYSGYNSTEVDWFHHNSSLIKSLQRSNNVNNADDYKFDDRINTTYISPNKTINFHHSDVHKLLGIINAQQLDIFFKYNINNIADKADAFGNYDNDENPNTPAIYHELKRPYSLYNWELFFHTPIMVADALSKAQQFEEAMKWFHYVFYPIADGVDDNRFWQFAPFKEVNSKRTLDSIFNNLKPNTKNDAINEWRNKPFMPHVVARIRPVAYMKYVVMKYIDNILDWGDYLFRQDTIESINQATQLYVLAGHILGPKPMMIPKRGDVKTQTYLSLLDKWDAFGNAIVEMELAAPFSNQTTLPYGMVNGEIAFTNIFGFSTASYFCIPNNPKLMGYWDTLADRLFKIRHCQNIEGVFRMLPLFEPPIDPALLVKAAAQGLSISSVVNDLNTAMPNYRFYYLLQKALELCNELKSLGGAMLSAIEKKDNESISLIRARHEGSMTNLIMEIKKLQLEESQKSLESLYQNRKSPEARMNYYLQLIGEDANKVPGLDSDFTELANSIEKPIDESGLRLSKFEKEDMDKANLSAILQLSAGIPEALASILYVIPMLAADVKPFGLGAGASFGGTNLGQLTQAVSKGLQIAASHLSHQSSIAAKKGGFQRALQERIMQANAAGFELKQIDKQITTQQIRINITNQEILNQQKQIDNANEVEEFLKNKYTNEELYIWMRGSLKTLYHQVYNLAYDLAKKAEKTYCFERGISNAGFIQSGYFDAGREGLLAGEQLYVGLKQLEAAYQEKRGYDYEITKHISLRQLDPLALLQLKAACISEFDLPEVLFDMDYPGHFKRRIKSVSVSIPCIAGPYTGVNATLRLLNNKFRNSSIANNYPEKADDRFISYNIPITAIATSSAQNDAGMFELNFKDERYLPFEGAGVISRWRLELPTIKQFDYNTISDVVLHVKYIASEGGEQLKESAKGSVTTQLNQISQQLNETGLHIPISLKHDMPNEWNLLVKTGTANITIDKSRLPYMTHNPSIDHLILISNVKIEKFRCFHNTEVDINFDQIVGIDNLYISNEIKNVSLDAKFDIYGYKTEQKHGTTAPPVIMEDVVDNTELKLLDELMLIVKYSF